MERYPAQVCLGGHWITERADIPENCKDLCPECGKETIDECQNCKAYIPGAVKSGDSHGFHSKPPDRCYNCHEPYPWSEA